MIRITPGNHHVSVVMIFALVGLYGNEQGTEYPAGGGSEEVDDVQDVCAVEALRGLLHPCQAHQQHDADN